MRDRDERAGAEVTYVTPAEATGDCLPQSGSVFWFGTTDVTCYREAENPGIAASFRVAVCYPPCVPTSCEEQGLTEGTIDDGCGQVLDCSAG